MNTGIGIESSVIKRDGSKSGESYTRILKSVLMGTIAAMFASVILLMVFAIIINGAFGDPDGVLGTFTVAAASIGALIGGFYASRSNGSKGLLCGLSTGTSMSVILLLVMLFTGTVNSEDASAAFRLTTVLCQVIFACIGGVFAVNAHKTKKTSYHSIHSISKKK